MTWSCHMTEVISCTLKYVPYGKIFMSYHKKRVFVKWFCMLECILHWHLSITIRSNGFTEGWDFHQQTDGAVRSGRPVCEEHRFAKQQPLPYHSSVSLLYSFSLCLGEYLVSCFSILSLPCYQTWPDDNTQMSENHHYGDLPTARKLLRTWEKPHWPPYPADGSSNHCQQLPHPLYSDPVLCSGPFCRMSNVCSLLGQSGCGHPQYPLEDTELQEMGSARRKSGQCAGQFSVSLIPATALSLNTHKARSTVNSISESHKRSLHFNTNFLRFCITRMEASTPPPLGV